MSDQCEAPGPGGIFCKLPSGHVGDYHLADRLAWEARKPVQMRPCQEPTRNGVCALPFGHDGEHAAMSLAEAMVPLAIATGVVSLYHA